MGSDDRDAYVDEFGAEPIVGEVGDWDAAGWSEAWRAINNEFEFDDDAKEDAYQECRIAYLRSLFDSEDVA